MKPKQTHRTDLVVKGGEGIYWIALLYTRNQHNIVNQLYSNKKKLKIKKDWSDIHLVILFDQIIIITMIIVYRVS